MSPPIVVRQVAAAHRYCSAGVVAILLNDASSSLTKISAFFSKTNFLIISHAASMSALAGLGRLPALATTNARVNVTAASADLTIPKPFCWYRARRLQDTGERHMRTNRINTLTRRTMTVDSGEEFTVEVRGAFDDVEESARYRRHSRRLATGTP